MTWHPLICTLVFLPCLLLAATLVLPRTAAAGGPVTAVRASDFLNSLGTMSAISVRGENLPKTIECAKYLGVRWFRAGVEGNIPMQQFIDLHKQAGLRFAWGLGSNGSNIPKLIETGRQVAAAGALLAFEGPNEPNTWAITYQDEKGGGPNSWLPVAKLMRDLYKAVKSDPVLKDYPVWNVSDNGAQNDNVGLQFLTIPQGAGTLMPDGTKYADYANCHDYITHGSIKTLIDNLPWNAAGTEPHVSKAGGLVDGLYGTYCVTWKKHFKGYPQADLPKLPRVVTENGWLAEGGGKFTEENQGVLHLSLYLDHFKRGWSYTAIYLLRDRSDEAGNQSYGFYRKDYTPRKSAHYLHNLTTILADSGSIPTPGKLNYSIPNQPETVHDLLLQKSDGTFALVVWNERFAGGSDNVTVNLGATFTSVKVYDPTIGTAATETLANVSAVPLKLTNHPVILEMQPRP